MPLPLSAPAHVQVRFVDTQTGVPTTEQTHKEEDSPLPASLGVSPLEKVVLARYSSTDPDWFTHADVLISTGQPVAYFHRDIETANIRLADYADLTSSAGSSRTPPPVGR